MASTAPLCHFGWKAIDARLPGTEGRARSILDLAGPNGLVVAFICNHCPYVKAVIGRIVRDALELEAHGIGFVAINSNDATAYPEDSFDNMKRFAADHALPFPYLHDADQWVARAYGAVCTPDFFGFNKRMELQYRGRLDASRKEIGPSGSQARPVRGHGRHRPDRQRAGRAVRGDRLFDQMEAGPVLGRGGDDDPPLSRQSLAPDPLRTESFTHETPVVSSMSQTTEAADDPPSELCLSLSNPSGAAGLYPPKTSSPARSRFRKEETRTGLGGRSALALLKPAGRRIAWRHGWRSRPSAPVTARHRAAARVRSGAHGSRPSCPG